MKHMEKMNEAFGMDSLLTVDEGGKRIVCPFISRELWKCIGCVILKVTYGKNDKNLE